MGFAIWRDRIWAELWIIGQLLYNLPGDSNTDYRHIAKPWPLVASLKNTPLAETDKKYRRQTIENPELDLPYLNVSLVRNWSVIIAVLLISSILAIIAPFLPSRYGAFDWTFPTSWNEYNERSINVLILGAVILVLVLISRILSNIRTFVDRLFRYKKVGVFKVKNVFNLANSKVVILNNYHFLSLEKKDHDVQNIEVGQFLVIERTATHKLIDFEIKK